MKKNNKRQERNKRDKNNKKRTKKGNNAKRKNVKWDSSWQSLVSAGSSLWILLLW